MPDITFDGNAPDFGAQGCRQDCLCDQAGHSAETTVQPGLPSPTFGRFRTICADPPWHYWKRSQDRTHRGRLPYGSLTVEDICSLPVASVAAPNAHLYLWTTNAFLPDAHRIAEAWGFRQKTILTWVKTQIGLGDYFRNNTEHVLFAVRGRLPTLRKDCPTAFTAPRGRHSAKPPAFFDLVESVSPGPYLEIFGRSMARLGWISLGNEVGDGGDIRDALERLARQVAA